MARQGYIYHNSINDTYQSSRKPILSDTTTLVEYFSDTADVELKKALTTLIESTADPVPEPVEKKYKCRACSRHYSTKHTLATHKKTKKHLTRIACI